MAPIDNGEEKIERVTSEIGRAGTQTVVRVTMRIAADASKFIVGQTLRAGEASVRRMANWASAALTKPGGQVSMKELSELPSRTGREVVSLDDKDVMQALEKNLKGRGVHYAIEREKIDGKVQHILHVRGDDAQVVADSLERAAEAVDAKREHKHQQDRTVDRDTPTRDNSTKPEQSKPAQDGQAAPKKQATETKDRQQSEKKPGEKRSSSDDAKKPKEVRQREIRERVKARADKIKAEAPKPVPKIDSPSPGLKR